MIRRQQLLEAYLIACETELQAFKPGNVSVYSEGHDMTVADFRVSANASAGPITDTGLSFGERVFYAVQATRNAVGCNTNLGIILLCAPLMLAMETRLSGESLQTALVRVLCGFSQNDADWVFKAIALASPGGLGEVEQGDVKQLPAISLMEAMQLAKDRDQIAELYTTNYKVLFDFCVLEYNRAFVLSDKSDWAALSVFAHMLAVYPDSHIERKHGKQYSDWIKSEMMLLCQQLESTDAFEVILPRLHELDQAFKGKSINPGTTADITVATVLIAQLLQLMNCCSTNGS